MLSIILDNIYVQNVPFGINVYQQNVGIPMDTNYVPLIADLQLILYFNKS